LIAVNITPQQVLDIKNSLPVLPSVRKENYINLGLSDYDAGLLVASKTISDYFDEVYSKVNNAKLVANWIINEVLRKTVDNNILISANNFAELLQLVASNEISATAGKQVFEQLWGTDNTASQIVEKLGLKQISDSGELQKIVEQVVNNNPKSVEDYKSGNVKAIGFLVGQVMKVSAGKANPQKVNELLKQILD
jgi:aspartyl-tRNA(Asn)/glutamyl-tRNA(Gln) amidotransferase subunit B